jgi:hypothetical protein
MVLMPYLLFLIVSTIIVPAASENADFRFFGSAGNTIYAYEDTGTHIKLYQTAAFTLEKPGKNHLSLNTMLGGLTDLNKDFNNVIDDDDQLKIYDLNLTGKNLLNNHLYLRMGRQFLHPGTVLGGLDGLYVKGKFLKKLSLAAYGGLESHFQNNASLQDADKGAAAGGWLRLRDLFATNIQLFYLQKFNMEEIFWQIIGANIRNNLLPRTETDIQCHYDLLNARFHRIAVGTRHPVIRQLMLNLGYKRQLPQIYANSFFTLFKIKAYQQIKAGFSYNFFRSFLLNNQYQLLVIEGDMASKLLTSVGNNWGSIGILYETGYVGEQIGAVADFAYDIIESLTISANIDYSMYKPEEIYEFDKQLANAARLSYRIKNRWLVELEYQWLFNRFKEYDSRILNRIRFTW